MAPRATVRPSPAVGSAGRPEPADPGRLAALSPEAAPAKPRQDRRPSASEPVEHDLARSVGAALADLACVRVTASEVGPLGDVLLAGLAAHDNARAEAVARVEGVPGVVGVAADGLVSVRAPCALFEFLERTEARSAAGREPLPERIVQPRKAAELGLTTPAFESHILIDYFDEDGAVHHLDSDNWPAGTFAPNARATFGGEDGHGLPIFPKTPGERDIILAIASSAALERRPRVRREDAAGYLARLAGAVEASRAAGEAVEIFATVIHTAPAPDGLAGGQASPLPATR